jgi:uncharacterized membrane protein
LRISYPIVVIVVLVVGAIEGFVLVVVVVDVDRLSHIYYYRKIQNK